MVKFKYAAILLALATLSLSSCVSKKKFLDMQSGRLRAEAKVRQLENENQAKAERITALIADFESMKNELLFSNAQKEHYIDSLKAVISQLNEELHRQSRSLEETSFTLDFEKQRLTEALKSKEQSIQKLQNEIEDLESSLSDKQLEVDQKNFEIGQLKERARSLERKIESQENQISKLRQQLTQKGTELDKLSKQMREKDAEITKLSNQVKLLKSQIGN